MQWPLSVWHWREYRYPWYIHPHFLRASAGSHSSRSSFGRGLLPRHPCAAICCICSVACWVLACLCSWARLAVLLCCAVRAGRELDADQHGRGTDRVLVQLEGKRYSHTAAVLLSHACSSCAATAQDIHWTNLHTLLACLHTCLHACTPAAHPVQPDHRRPVHPGADVPDSGHGGGRPCW